MMERLRLEIPTDSSTSEATLAQTIALAALMTTAIGIYLTALIAAALR